MTADDAKLRECSALADQKRLKLQNILEIARSQTDMIERDDAQGLDASMERRISLGREIDELDVRLASLGCALGIPAGDAGADTQTSPAETIRQIQGVDRANEANINARIGQYQKNIRQMRLSSKGREMYTQVYEKADGIFFDVKK